MAGGSFSRHDWRTVTRKDEAVLTTALPRELRTLVKVLA